MLITHNMKNKKLLLGIAWAWLTCLSANAEVKLPAFFSDGMVMQQQTRANLWGTATPNAPVKITTSWDKQTYKTIADAKGAWKLALSTPSAGGPYTITFDDGKLTEIRDILMGELWLCSGQSNMEMPMKGFKNQPVENSNTDVMNSRNPQLRLFTVKRAKIPQSEADIKSKNRTPTVLYNGMLHPLIGLAMRGVIWYQGEDNYNRASTYADMFSALIRGWREEWQQGEFPFYYCQIAPYDYGIITEPGKNVINSAYLREQQAMVEHRVGNSGMAVLLDAGMKTGIHPGKKKVAGERLARLALVKTYGMKGVTAESPYYTGMEVKNDTVIVSFDRAQMWINCKDRFESYNFQVAGKDRVFYPAKAWIQRSKMLVKSERVPHPVAVRYGFENYVEGDLFGEDLPVSSFRSDDW